MKLLLYRKPDGDWQLRQLPGEVMGDFPGTREIVPLLRELKSAYPQARFYVPERYDNPTVINIWIG